MRVRLSRTKNTAKPTRRLGFPLLDFDGLLHHLGLGHHLLLGDAHLLLDVDVDLLGLAFSHVVGWHEALVPVGLPYVPPIIVRLAQQEQDLKEKLCNGSYVQKYS